jgi:hypothetical protein
MSEPEQGGGETSPESIEDRLAMAVDFIERATKLLGVLNRARKRIFDSVVRHAERNPCPTREDERLYRKVRRITKEMDKRAQEIGF